MHNYITERTTQFSVLFIQSEIKHVAPDKGRFRGDRSEFVLIIRWLMRCL